MKARNGSSRSATTTIAPNSVCHHCGSESRVTAKNEISPATTMLMIATARRSRAMDAVVICGGQRSIRSSTFNGSPATPRTVKKLMASAARRTRNSRPNAGRAASGNEIAQPQVRSTCHTALGSRMIGSASPSCLALARVSSRLM